MRVAVTGGSGHIGHALCTALAERGDDVINLDRRMPPTPAGKFVYCDARRRELLQPVFEQVDAVCLLGEYPNPHAAPPEEIFATNTAISSTALQTAADAKVKRVIYTSSCQAYGQWEEPNVAPKKIPFDETTLLNPQNVYALSKMANEAYARQMSERCGLSVAAFRFPAVLVEHHFRYWSRDAKAEPKSLDGLGTYVHLTDAVRAYLLALDRPRPGFEAYHFTAATVKYQQPLRDVIAKFRPDYPPLPADWPDFKSPVLTDKAKAHFGWEPTWEMHHELAKRNA